ncbi:MAG: hypothetical protein JZU63_12000, partial [Rhodoferax sp.]|nr:hypothetical protein [Rhodoferax sp.]
RGFTKELFRNIFPLLQCQPYIERVIYAVDRPRVDYDLNQFRHHWTGKFNNWYAKVGWKAPVNIMRSHMAAFNLTDCDEEQPWLTIPDANVPRGGVIFSRSHTYHNPEFPWPKLVSEHRHHACFIGRDSEYLDFVDKYGPIKRIVCANLLDVAVAISACDLFIGNQSCPCAIAEGLKKPLIQECFGADPNCMFNRKGVVYVLQQKLVDASAYTSFK